MNLMTIGFTRTSAESFFDRLRSAGTVRVIDTRLNNRSQLAGFAKSRDLAYFLRTIGGIDYCEHPLMVPEQGMLQRYRKTGDWPAYEREFLDLLDARRIDRHLQPEFISGSCLLCSESTADHCHRRLVAEYLQDRWSLDIRIQHL